ncbi:hypothetical protein [Kitasatospora cystarginea]
MLTPAQSVQIEWLGQAATSACMKRYGQTLPVPQRPSADSPALAAYTVMNRRYGLMDPDAARTCGYHLPQSVTGTAATDRPVVLSQLSAQAQTVLLGLDPKTGTRVTTYAGTPLPEHGCLGELERILPGSSGGPAGPGSNADGVVTDIKTHSFTDSLADPRVVAAISAWSGCMKTHGYTLTDPLKAPDGIASMADPRPSSSEIAQAEADVACKRSANLIGIWFAAESELQNKAIEQHAAQLKAVKFTLASESESLDRLFSQDWTSPRPGS